LSLRHSKLIKDKKFVGQNIIEGLKKNFFRLCLALDVYYEGLSSNIIGLNYKIAI